MLPGAIPGPPAGIPGMVIPGPPPTIPAYQPDLDRVVDDEGGMRINAQVSLRPRIRRATCVPARDTGRRGEPPTDS